MENFAKTLLEAKHAEPFNLVDQSMLSVFPEEKVARGVKGFKQSKVKEKN